MKSEQHLALKPAGNIGAEHAESDEERQAIPARRSAETADDGEEERHAEAEENLRHGRSGHLPVHCVAGQERLPLLHSDQVSDRKQADGPEDPSGAPRRAPQPQAPAHETVDAEERDLVRVHEREARETKAGTHSVCCGTIPQCCLGLHRRLEYQRNREREERVPQQGPVGVQVDQPEIRRDLGWVGREERDPAPKAGGKGHQRSRDPGLCSPQPEGADEAEPHVDKHNRADRFDQQVGHRWRRAGHPREQAHKQEEGLKEKWRVSKRGVLHGEEPGAPHGLALPRQVSQRVFRVRRQNPEKVGAVCLQTAVEVGSQGGQEQKRAPQKPSAGCDDVRAAEPRGFPLVGRRRERGIFGHRTEYAAARCLRARTLPPWFRRASGYLRCRMCPCRIGSFMEFSKDLRDRLCLRLISRGPCQCKRISKNRSCLGQLSTLRKCSRKVLEKADGMRVYFRCSTKMDNGLVPSPHSGQ